MQFRVILNVGDSHVPGARMKSKSILIVDDEPKVGLSLKESLESLDHGYAVSQARSAEEALHALREVSYDLVVTDLRMPGMNGLQLLERVKHDSPHTRLILITAYGSEEVAAATRGLQTIGYFTKPFQIEEFLQVVDRALSNSKRSIPSPLASDKYFDRLVQRLRDLRFESGAQCIVLADAAGQVLTKLGSVEELKPELLAAMVSDGSASSFEVVQNLREERGFNLVYYEGVRFDIYSANVDAGLFIALAFDRRQGSSRIGMVWLYTRRAIQEIQTWVSGTG